MQLKVQIEERSFQIDVPESLLDEAQSFFQKMDGDMDRGWQMSREFVPDPTITQRCQIAADRLYTAIENDNTSLAQLMAGYILAHMPGVIGVDIDTTGDMQNTEFSVNDPTMAPAPGPKISGKIPKLEAMQRAGQDVSKVYRVGRTYRYAVYDYDQERWVESELFSDEADADASRLLAVQERFSQLVGESD